MKLHLGCGSNVIPGWVNIDMDPPKGGVKHDLTKGIPYPDCSVSFIYHEHMLEHLGLGDGMNFMKECLRVLKVGGIMRVSTPNLMRLVREYLANRVDLWLDVGWKPETPCAMMNEGMRSWEHKYLYDKEELQLRLTQMGFGNIRKCLRRKSQHPDLQFLEIRPDCDDLIYECSKQLLGTVSADVLITA